MKHKTNNTNRGIKVFNTAYRIGILFAGIKLIINSRP